MNDFINNNKDKTNKNVLSLLHSYIELYQKHLQLTDNIFSFKIDNLSINDIRYLIKYYQDKDENSNINLNEKIHNKQLSKLLSSYSMVDFIYDINQLKVIPNINIIGGYSESHMNEIIKQLNLK